MKKENNKAVANMIEPAIGSLLENVDSRFTLVIAVAKRARQITEGAHRITDCTSKKPVSIATHEIHEKMITYIRTKSGLK